jgi:hypothetical protein
MSLDSSSFIFVSPLSFNHIMTVNGTHMPLTYIGFVITPHLSLPNIYLILNLTLNLVSVSQIYDSGDYLVIFSFFFCCVQDLQSQKLIGTGRKEKGLYILDELKVLVDVTTSVDLTSFCWSPSSNFYLWHSRLGHVLSSLLRFLVSTGALKNLKLMIFLIIVYVN